MTDFDFSKLSIENWGDVNQGVVFDETKFVTKYYRINGDIKGHPAPSGKGNRFWYSIDIYNLDKEKGVFSSAMENTIKMGTPSPKWVEFCEDNNRSIYDFHAVSMGYPYYELMDDADKEKFHNIIKCMAEILNTSRSPTDFSDLIDGTDYPEDLKDALESVFEMNIVDGKTPSFYEAKDTSIWIKSKKSDKS